MRGFIAALIALCIWASPAYAGVALVSGQTAAPTSGFGSSTLTVTLPNNPTTGNLVAVCTIDDGNGTQSVADANSNSYTPTTQTPFSGSAAGLGVFYLDNTPSNASKNITVTRGTASAFLYAFAIEVSGVATSSVFEQDATAFFGGPGHNS